MKKFVFILALVLMFSLTACSRQSPSPNGDAQPENVIMLDAGVWPENAYTEGLPLPPGTVDWAMLDTRHENCSICVVDISEKDCEEYIALLKQAGFSVVEEVSEEVQGQNYVSVGTLLSDGAKGLSISYASGALTIYISLKGEA